MLRGRAEAGNCAATATWGRPGIGYFDDPGRYPNAPTGTPWWRQVHGAKWSAPTGPGSSTEGREDNPVTHVSWYDAAPFCAFTGARLPTETEWEKAARGGLKHKLFPGGNQLEPATGHRHNIWQGEFPHIYSAEDGRAGTCPVGACAANGIGLFNMIGNIWEWCADWFGQPYVGRLCPGRVRSNSFVRTPGCSLC